MKPRTNKNADDKICDLLSSWHPSLRLSLILLAFFSVAPITIFIYKLIYNIYYAGENLYYVAYYANFGFYYFSIINARFGGFILLIFFLIWKKGVIADIVLATPNCYSKIKINNVWLRTGIYLTIIACLGFIIHGLKILISTTHQSFNFTDIFDFSVTTFFVPISEEIYFRFIMLGIIATILGRIPAIFVSTLFFAISHDLSQPPEIVWAALMGLVNSLTVIGLGTLWPAIGIHIINNIVTYSSHPF